MQTPRSDYFPWQYIIKVATRNVIAVRRLPSMIIIANFLPDKAMSGLANHVSIFFLFTRSWQLNTSTEYYYSPIQSSGSSPNKT